MPFANTGRSVASLLLQQSRQSQAFGRDQRRAEPVQNAGLQARPPVVPARKHAVAAGRANGRSGMGLGERHALRRKPVDTWRCDFAAFRIQTMHIAVAEIVTQNINDVRCFRRRIGSLEYGHRRQQQSGTVTESYESHNVTDGNGLARVIRSLYLISFRKLFQHSIWRRGCPLPALRGLYSMVIGLVSPGIRVK